MTISKRCLGKNGPQVSAIGLGCMGMSAFYGPSNTLENLEVLNRAIDLGCNFFDTSDLYGCGENEKLIGKVLSKRRDEVFLCTKFGFGVDVETKERFIRGDKEYVFKCCNSSLERLGINCIDLYYQHRVDPKTPIEETVTAMAELVKEGKVKYLGLSECSGDTLRRAYKIHPIAAVQVEYSPWEISPEKNGLLDACRELGVSIVAYSPLGRGFLTGKLDIDTLSNEDYRNSFPRMTGENLEHNTKLVNKIKELALSKNVTPSQLCLSWVLHQGEDFIPIPGTRRVKYLKENLAALDIKLTDQEERQVRDIVNEVQVKGDRYPAVYMNSLNI